MVHRKMNHFKKDRKYPNKTSIRSKGKVNNLLTVLCVFLIKVELTLIHLLGYLSNIIGFTHRVKVN